MTSSLNFKNLAYFHEIVRQGGLTKAARYLGMNQPNLSRVMRELEEQTGEILFSSSKSGFKLSPAGQRLWELAQQYVETTTDIERKLGKSKPVLRIGASENLCLHVLPKIFTLSELAPYSVELLSGTSRQIEDEVSTLNLDIGVFYQPPQSEIFVRKIVGEVEFVLIYPKKFKVKRLQDLSHFAFVGSRTNDYAHPFFALQALHHLKVDVNLKYQCNSQEAQVRMVEQGLGYSLVPWFMVKDRSLGIQVKRIQLHSRLYVVRKGKPTESKLELYEKIESALRLAVSSRIKK